MEIRSTLKKIAMEPNSNCRLLTLADAEAAAQVI
jgi:hypothetical protein